MTEFHHGILASFAILIGCIFSTLAWFGGREEHYLGVPARIWGRWIAPITLCSFTIALAHFSDSYVHWMWLSIPVYIASFYGPGHGYDGPSLFHKIMRRAIHSLLRTSCSAVFCIWTGRWSIFITQVVCGLLIEVLMGTDNPIKPPQEECLINFGNTAFVPFMVL